MRIRNEELYKVKKEHIMEACFECYSENGFHGTGLSTLAKNAGVSKATLYTYFKDIDELIIESTEYCMGKVEDDFMSLAPNNQEELMKFIDEVPYWTKEKHGKKYRLMYQIYTHPKYKEAGKKFFKGVDKRYTDYSKILEDKIGISYEITTPLIFIFVRACVHFTLFEDEFYLKTQLKVLKSAIRVYLDNKEKDI